ncbi:MAG TPA: hypothetical protein VJ901_10145 [Thermoanaerobaculia bacterium]|nr:hypothetical protein [Thermoanaerobaculia bacterium]
MRALLAVLLVQQFLSLTSDQLNRPADAAGAVGPHHIVGVSNLGVVVQSRGGEVVKMTTLNEFWSGGAVTGVHYFDSRVMYDAAADRWVLGTLFVEDFPKSSMLIATSDSGDPAGSWTRMQIEVPTQNVFIDFPRMALTTDRVIVTVNSSGGSEILTFPAHTQTTTSMHDLQPVTSDGPDALFLHNDKSGTVDLYRLDGSTLKPVGHFTTEPWQSPANTAIAPQLDSASRMDVGDTTFQSAVARNGFVWAVHTIVTNNRSAIRWWKIAADGSHAETGTIGDAASFYAFPSIAVNRQNAALISYCVFSAQLHPSMGYSYRDGNGVTSTEISSSGTSVPNQQRWGDFTTTVTDPLNDLDFWSAGLASSGAAWSAWWSEIRSLPPARIRVVRH